MVLLDNTQGDRTMVKGQAVEYKHSKYYDSYGVGEYYGHSFNGYELVRTASGMLVEVLPEDIKAI